MEEPPCFTLYVVFFESYFKACLGLSSSNFSTHRIAAYLAPFGVNLSFVKSLLVEEVFDAS